MKNPTIFKNTLFIFSCVLLTVLGLTVLDANLNADATTTIGLDINTGNITSSGTITSQDLIVQKEGNATLTVYSDIDSATTDSKLLVVQKGTSPSELFSVDEDGDVAIANDLAVAGNVTAGTWQGTPIATQYGGTGQNWLTTTKGSLPYFSGTGTLSNLAPGAAGQFLKSQGDGADLEWGNVTRSATFVVAASDSLNKEQADYVCDGVDDQVEIQAAIDALYNGGIGGIVYLLEGRYYISSTITLHGSSVSLVGSGMSAIGTLLSLTDNSDCDILEYYAADGETFYFAQIRNIMIDGNKTKNASGNGIKVHRTGTGKPNDLHIEHVFIQQCKDNGIYIAYGWGVHIDHVISEYNGQSGFLLNGDQTYASNIFAAHNEQHGVYATSGNQLITNAYSEDNGWHGFYILNGGVQLSNCIAEYNNREDASQDEFCVRSDNSILTNCRAVGYSGTPKPLAGFEVYSGTNNQLIGCAASDCSYPVLINDTAVNTIIIGGIYENMTDNGVHTIKSVQHSNFFMDVLAASTDAVHAAITGNGEEQEITTGITNPDVARNISITTTNSSSPSGNVTITGVDAKGNSTTEDIAIVAGGTTYGDVAFATVTKITIPTTVASPDTISVGFSDKLGLSNVIYDTSDVYKVKKNTADATIGTVDTTNGTVDCATISGDDDFTIYYKSNLNIIN